MISRIEFRNIALFGNKSIVIDNLYDEAHMWLLMGENGAGKSTLSKILKLGLYRDTDGVPIGEIANSVNKNGYIRIDINDNGKLIIVETYWAPDKINVYEGGYGPEFKKDLGKKPETQKWILENVCKIPLHIFNAIISINIRDFKSFLSMNAKDTRNIRDRLAGFYVLNEMNERFNKRVGSSLKRMEELNNKLSGMKETEDGLDRSIEETRDQILKEWQQKLENRRAEVEDQKQKLSKYEEQLSNLVEKRGSLLKIMEASNATKLSESKAELEKKISELEQDIKSKEESKQDVVADIKRLENYKLVLKKSELVSKVEELEKNEIDPVKQKVSAIQKQRDQLQQELNEKEEKYKHYTTYAPSNKVAKSLFDRKAEIRDCLVKAKNMVGQKQEYESSIQKYSDTISKLRDKISEKRTQKSIEEKALESVKSGTCPTCQKVYEGKEQTDKVSDIEQTLSEIDNAIKVHEDTLYNTEKLRDETLNSVSSITESIRSMKSSASEYANKVITLARALMLEGSWEYSKKGETHKPSNFDEITDMTVIFELLEHIMNISEVKEEDAEIEEVYNDLTEKFNNVDRQFKELDNKIITLTVKKEAWQKEIDDLAKSIDNHLKHPEQVKTWDDLKTSMESLEKKKEEIEDALFTLKTDSSKTDLERVNESLQKSRDFLPEDQLEEYTKLSKKYSEERLKELDSESVTKQSQAEELISQTRAELRQTEIAIKELEDEDVEKNLQVMIREKQSIQEKMDIITKELTDLNDKNRVNEVVSLALGNKGIKKMILADITPYINEKTNSLLQRFEFPLAVKFDDEFKAQLYRFNMPASSAGISTGQEMIINYCISLAWTLFVYHRYGGINVVFYDELLSNIDTYRRPKVLQLIKEEVVENLNMNAVIVNHSYLPGAYFDKSIELEIVNSFTQAKIRDLREDEVTN